MSGIRLSYGKSEILYDEDRNLSDLPVGSMVKTAVEGQRDVKGTWDITVHSSTQGL